MKLRNVRIIIAVIVLFTLACVCSSTPAAAPEKIGEATQGSAPSSSYTSYAVGDIIQTGTSTITLNSASIQGNTLHANFTVENQSTDELPISSLLLFTAKDDDGTNLTQEIFECESGGLDGTILPGDKLKGNICWSGVVSDSAKIYYSSLFSSSGTVVWEIKK